MRILASFLWVLVALCSGVPRWAGAQSPANTDVICVANGAEPTDGREVLKLKELWRVGGEDDDTFFGLVAKVETDAQGRVYILDSQTCQIYMYSPDGELIRTLFREGEGPGEILRARDMLLMADGRVGVIQEFPGTVSFVWPNGDPAGRVQFVGPNGGVVSLTSCLAREDAILVAGTHSSEGRRPEIRVRLNGLERYDEQGQMMTRYEEQATEYNFADFQFRESEHLPAFWFSYAVASDGRVYSASGHDDYRINVHGASGELERTIERQYDPIERTSAEIRRLELMVLSAFNGAPFEPSIHILKTASPLAYFQRAIQLHDDGSLWVLTGRGVRPESTETMAVFDVFDSAGVFAKQMELQADHKGSDVGIFLSGPGRVLVVKGYMDSLAAQFGNGTALADEGYEPQPPEVICYELPGR